MEVSQQLHGERQEALQRKSEKIQNVRAIMLRTLVGIQRGDGRQVQSEDL